jgi:hypothetical protein
MSPFHVFSIQSTLSLIAFALIARWHVAPRLAQMSREEAVLPLLWVQVFRYAPLTLYAPGQVDPRIPADVAATVAFGDLAAAIVALAALVAVKHRAPGAIGLVWAFSVVGIADLVFATMKAVGVQMYTMALGWNWYILNFYVPMLVVSHVMILHHLVRAPSPKRRESPRVVPV